MQAHHFTANHHTTKTTIKAKAPDGASPVSLSVLSHNTSNLNTNDADPAPDHALIVLQQCGKANTQPIATFTPKQARELAQALYAAAEEHEAC